MIALSAIHITKGDIEKALKGEGTGKNGYRLIVNPTQNTTNKNAPVIGKVDGKNYVLYDNEIKIGGSLAWRNNNPGNIIKGKFSVKNGAIGENNRFAVFPSKQVGFEAIIALLKTKSYIDLSIIDAISKYAPAADSNDPEAYANNIYNKTGIDTDRKISDLSYAELTKVATAIEWVEGSIKGTVYSINDSKAPESIKQLFKQYR